MFNQNEYNKKYRKEHAEEIRIYNKKWRKEHPENVKRWTIKYEKSHLEEIRKRREKKKKRKPRILLTKEELKKRRNKRQKDWRRKNSNNPLFRLNENIISQIRRSLNGEKRGRHWEILVGYTLKDLAIHLEKLFDENMNWEDYGPYWHIDHIKPKSLFTIEEFRQCWALNNLQPLERIENLKKGIKYIVS